MKKMLKCDECGWIGEQKDLKQATKTENGAWGCLRCGHIFFKYVYCTKDEEEDEHGD